MKILIAGSSGFVGSELVSYFQSLGHEVWRLVRDQTQVKKNCLLWDPTRVPANVTAYEGFDAFVNLAGENIAGIWTDAKKKRLRDSRIITTETFCGIIKKLKNKPKVLVNASAMGIYGNRGDEILTEQSALGKNFMAILCQDWEKAAMEAETTGVRVVCLRTSLVLSTKDGVLKKMLIPFRLGLGGKLGSGKQFMSWVSLQDMCRIILHLIVREEIKGPVNISTEHPVRNVAFTKTLGNVLHRPTLFPVPTFVLRTLLGELGDNLLSSIRMTPEVLQKSNYTFIHNLSFGFLGCH